MASLFRRRGHACLQGAAHKLFRNHCKDRQANPWHSTTGWNRQTTYGVHCLCLVVILLGLSQSHSLSPLENQHILVLRFFMKQHLIHSYWHSLSRPHSFIDITEPSISQSIHYWRVGWWSKPAKDEMTKLLIFSPIFIMPCDLDNKRSILCPPHKKLGFLEADWLYVLFCYRLWI